MLQHYKGWLVLTHVGSCSLREKANSVLCVQCSKWIDGGCSNVDVDGGCSNVDVDGGCSNVDVDGGCSNVVSG